MKSVAVGEVGSIDAQDALAVEAASVGLGEGGPMLATAVYDNEGAGVIAGSLGLSPQVHGLVGQYAFPFGSTTHSHTNLLTRSLAL